MLINAAKYIKKKEIQEFVMTWDFSHENQRRRYYPSLLNVKEYLDSYQYRFEFTLIWQYWNMYFYIFQVPTYYIMFTIFTDIDNYYEFVSKWMWFIDKPRAGSTQWSIKVNALLSNIFSDNKFLIKFQWKLMSYQF